MTTANSSNVSAWVWKMSCRKGTKVTAACRPKVSRTVASSAGLEKKGVRKKERWERMAYPNPVKDMIQISGTAPIDRVQVLDPAGRIVFTDRFRSGSYDLQLGLGHLSNGIYQLSVEAQGSISFLRIVVSH